MDDNNIISQILLERHKIEQKIFVVIMNAKSIVPVAYDKSLDTIRVGKYVIKANSFSDEYVVSLIKIKAIKRAILTNKNQIAFLYDGYRWSMSTFNSPVVSYRNNGVCLIFKPYKNALKKPDEEIKQRAKALLERGFVAKKYAVTPLSVRIVFQNGEEEKTENFQ